MKIAQNNPEKIIWESMRNPGGALGKALPKMMAWLILFVFSTYIVYTLKLVSSHHSACEEDSSAVLLNHRQNVGVLESDNRTTHRLTLSEEAKPVEEETGLQHIVFGIAASAKLWSKRKEYIKLWWRPEKGMRGTVWLDSPVKTHLNESGALPELRISGDTSLFAYRHKQGNRSAIRISRINLKSIM